MPPCLQQPPRPVTRTLRAGLLGLVLAGIAMPTAQAYEEDFHYYVVYYVVRARGYSPAQANELAGFSQYVDDNRRTEPIWTYSSRRARFHFAGSDPDKATTRNEASARERVRVAFELYLKDDPGGKYLAGVALHLLADTFSHESFTAWHNARVNERLRWFPFPIGHADTAECGHFPDRIYNNSTGALAAAYALYKLIPPAAPQAPVREWLSVQEPLALTLEHQRDGFADEIGLHNRITRMRALIKKTFGESPEYQKSEFAAERDNFEASVLDWELLP